MTKKQTNRTMVGRETKSVLRRAKTHGRADTQQKTEDATESQNTWRAHLRGLDANQESRSRKRCLGTNSPGRHP